jgi:hypothetical protein
MDPENAPTTPSNAPAADAQQPPAATAPASYTEADLAAAAKRAHDAAWADARRTFAGKPKELPRPAEPRNDQPTAPRQEAVDVAALVKAEAAKIRATERALSAFDLTDAARSILEADLDAANPADPSAWIAQRAEAFGLPRRGSAPQNAVTVTNNASPAPTAPPAPMPGAPPASPRITSDTPILQLAKRDPAALAELQRTNPAEFMRRLLDEMRSTRVPIYRG